MFATTNPELLKIAFSKELMVFLDAIPRTSLAQSKMFWVHKQI